MCGQMMHISAPENYRHVECDSISSWAHWSMGNEATQADPEDPAANAISLSMSNTKAIQPRSTTVPRDYCQHRGLHPTAPSSCAPPRPRHPSLRPELDASASLLIPVSCS